MVCKPQIFGCISWMVCKKPKIRKNPQNFNDFADIFPSEWYARYAWYAVNYAPAPTVIIIIISHAQAALLISSSRDFGQCLEQFTIFGAGSGSDRSRSGLTPPELPCIFAVGHLVFGCSVVVDWWFISCWHAEVWGTVTSVSKKRRDTFCHRQKVWPGDFNYYFFFWFCREVGFQF